MAGAQGGVAASFAQFCDWAVVCDVDEFINVHLGAGSLHDLISAVPEQTDAIAMPWGFVRQRGD